MYNAAEVSFSLEMFECTLAHLWYPLAVPPLCVSKVGIITILGLLVVLTTTNNTAIAIELNERPRESLSIVLKVDGKAHELSEVKSGQPLHWSPDFVMCATVFFVVLNAYVY